MSDTPPPGPGLRVPPERPIARPPNRWKQPPEGAFSRGEGFDWRRYRAALWRFKWVVLLITVLGTGAGVIATRFQNPQFEARATILIEATSDPTGQGPIQPGEQYPSTAWLELVKARPALDSVVVGMQLHIRADSVAKPRLAGLNVAEAYHPGAYRFSVSADGRSFTLTTDDGLLLQHGVLGDSVGQDLGFLWAPSAEQFEPGTAIEFAIDNIPHTSEGLAKRIRAELDRSGDFLRLSLIGPSPGHTAAVLDAVARRFVEVATELKRDELAEVSNIPDVRVFSPAVASSKPVRARESRRLITLAFLASLALGLGLAIMLDNGDPRVKSPDELGRLGLGILGAIPHVNTGRPGDSPGNADDVVEAFRLIRLNVTHAHGAVGPIVLAVTSPTGSEGKTFVATNLGLAFSSLGLRTLVLDADVRRGRVHRLLGGDRRPGLADYLGGAASLKQVVQPTRHKALYRITSGSRRRDAPELLQSCAMVSLVADLRSNCDVLIIDTPPIGIGADALALAALAGNLVVVIRTGSTQRELTEAKLDLVYRLPIRVLGAVLNDVPIRGIYGYHGSRYYSSCLPGYESRDEDEEETATSSGVCAVLGVESRSSEARLGLFWTE